MTDDLFGAAFKPTNSSWLDRAFSVGIELDSPTSSTIPYF